MPDGLRRFSIGVVVAIALIAAAPSSQLPARAGTGLLVGVDDDTLEWTFPGWRFIDAYEGLQLSAIRVTLHWRAGESSLDRLGRLYVSRVTEAQMNGNRVVLSIFGQARAAPATPEARDAYCSFVVDALRTAPSLRDVVIWNEVNSPGFWRPAGGRRAGAYVALLARCYDVVHQTFPRRYVNLISSTASRHDPRAFIARLGVAYRGAAGRVASSTPSATTRTPRRTPSRRMPSTPARPCSGRATTAS